MYREIYMYIYIYIYVVGGLQGSCGVDGDALAIESATAKRVIT